jgi:hypothetical protein
VSPAQLCLCWLASYYTLQVASRLFRLAPPTYTSKTSCEIDFLQGSVIEPTLFYLSSLGLLAFGYHISHQRYVEDMQLHICLSPQEPALRLRCIAACELRLSPLVVVFLFLFTMHGLSINPSQSDAVLLFSIRQRWRSMFPLSHAYVSGSEVELPDSLTNQRVILWQ